jgi:hypothetical protein
MDKHLKSRRTEVDTSWIGYGYFMKKSKELVMKKAYKTKYSIHLGSDEI